MYANITSMTELRSRQAQMNTLAVCSSHLRAYLCGISYLKLLHKSALVGLLVGLLHFADGSEELVGSNGCISAGDVVTECVVDEHILVLLGRDRTGGQRTVANVHSTRPNKEKYKYTIYCLR